MQKNKPILICSIILISITSFYGCNRGLVFPEPDFILSYNTPTGSYAKISEYRWSKEEDYELTPLPYTSKAVTIPGTDSVLIVFNSHLSGKTGAPSVNFGISKAFKNNQVEYLSNGTPFLKNASDFYSVFKTGDLDIISANKADNRTEGVDVSFGDSTLFVFQDYPVFGLFIPTPAFQDTFNKIEITKTQVDVDMASLFPKILQAPLTYRAIMVTIKFNFKLYNTAEPHQELQLTNGTFQSVFIETR